MTPEELLKDREEEITREIPNEDSTSREEKIILMQAILDIQPKIIVETGTHRGLTTCYMGLAAKEVGAHIYTYDPFDWGAGGNFAKFLDLPITYFKMPGKDCTIAHIDFAFIDGFHERIQVLKEITNIFPRLTTGATVYFHDTNGADIHCDVPGAIEQMELPVTYIQTLNGMAIYTHD